jgi:hypothetical protein
MGAPPEVPLLERLRSQILDELQTDSRPSFILLDRQIGVPTAEYGR